jgi:hypothetical protein
MTVSQRSPVVSRKKKTPLSERLAVALPPI